MVSCFNKYIFDGTANMECSNDTRQCSSFQYGCNQQAILMGKRYFYALVHLKQVEYSSFTEKWSKTSAFTIHGWSSVTNYFAYRQNNVAPGIFKQWMEQCMEEVLKRPRFIYYALALVHTKSRNLNNAYGNKSGSSTRNAVCAWFNDLELRCYNPCI